ncbi:exporter of polyketide antibiotics [Modestobacter marinus]|uniref:ABC-2 type transport system permease protein n=1 Tax=Modestobacter marinus TaxID=477641 RepID=A0A846LMA1_9ACTN|nr:ABC transporter permease [Modestobacter marinus]NIH68541.1 ABC-2 type transport system permease protein [Modestobacter marinus]GGL58032.1 exporter of polyketide antibiotics [Modestobacter marinus]
MSGATLAGTTELLRFAVRRDRLRLPIWLLAGGALMATQSTSNQTFYRTPEALAAYRASAGSNAASIAFSGPPVGLDTVAGTVAFEISTSLVVLTVLMAMFTTTRHTRADEEAGRTELVRSAQVGRHAPLVAATVLAALACAGMGVAIAAGAALTGLPVQGSVLLGSATASVGLVFTGVTAVCVQLTGVTRGVYGLVGGVLGVSLVVRAIGDITGSGLSWGSPVGWAQATHPWSADRWWPLLLPLAGTSVLVLAARRLLDRRDLGAGLLQPRPGAATAPRQLSSALGLAWRLHRGALAAWAVGISLLGLVYGGLAESVETLIGDNPDAQVFFQTSSTTDLVDAYLGVTLQMTALMVAGYAVSATIRARSEETSGRAEPVLATGVSRLRWLGSHLTVALLGATALLGLGGLATGVSRAVATGDAGAVLRLAGAALGYTPAVWVVAGLAAALVGAVPSAAAPTAWTVFGLLLVITLFAESFDWPGWVGGLSPLARTPTVPAEEWAAPPLLVLGGLAGALLALGLGAFRRRDLTTA